MFEATIVQTPTHQLYTEVAGDPEAPTCLLIPGAMEGTWGWSDRFCEPLVKQLRVIRFDHRDIGRSSSTPAGDEYALKDLAQDVMAVIDSLGLEKAHLVGHSMGGHLCQWLAAYHPDRVSSIIPIASGPIGATKETESPLTPEEEEILARTWQVFLARKDQEDPEAHVDGFLEVYRYLNGTVPFDEQEARTFVEAMLTRSEPQTLKIGNPHQQVMQKLGETMKERQGVLSRIGCPTLIIHGGEDPLSLPRLAHSMAEEIPGARIEMIPGMGHMFFNKELEKQIAGLVLKQCLGR